MRMSLWRGCIRKKSNFYNFKNKIVNYRNIVFNMQKIFLIVAFTIFHGYKIDAQKMKSLFSIKTQSHYIKIDTIVERKADYGKIYLEFDSKYVEKPIYILPLLPFNPYKIDPDINTFSKNTLPISHLIKNDGNKAELVDSFNRLGNFFHIRRFSKEFSNLYVIIPTFIQGIEPDTFKFITFEISDIKLIIDSLTASNNKNFLLETLIQDSAKICNSPFFVDHAIFNSLQIVSFYEFDSMRSVYDLKYPNYISEYSIEKEYNFSVQAYLDKEELFKTLKIRDNKLIRKRKNSSGKIHQYSQKSEKPKSTFVVFPIPTFFMQKPHNIKLKIVPFEDYKATTILHNLTVFSNNRFSINPSYDPDLMIATKDTNIAFNLYRFLINPNGGYKLYSGLYYPLYPIKNSPGIPSSLGQYYFNYKGRVFKSLIILECNINEVRYIGISIIFGSNLFEDTIIPDIIWLRI